jgi:hypothetical protein
MAAVIFNYFTFLCEKNYVNKSLLTAVQVIVEGWESFDPDSMADYDAIFSENSESVLLNIWTKQPGEGFGQLVMYHFLDQVGVNNTFVCTDLTEQGSRLIEKLERNGMLERLKYTGNPAYPHRFKVIRDATEGLKDHIAAISSFYKMNLPGNSN